MTSLLSDLSSDLSLLRFMYTGSILSPLFTPVYVLGFPLRLVMTSPYSDPIRIGFLLRFMISTFSLQCIRYLSFNSSRLSQFMTSGLFIPVCYDLFTPMVWCSCYDISAPIIRSLMRLRFLTTSPIQLIPLSDDSALLYSDLS